MKALWQTLCRLFGQSSLPATYSSTPSIFRIPRLERLENRWSPAAHDTLGTAIPLAFPANQQSQMFGTLSSSTDYYGFTAPATGGLTATVTPMDGTAFLPRLTLYGSSGQLLIQSDGQASAQLTQHLQSGTYYLAVSAIPGFADASDIESYQLDTTFQLALSSFQPLPVGQNPKSMAEGDFNGDGHLDLVTANNGDDTVSVLLGNGDGTFASAVPYNVGQNPSSVAVGDFTNNGRLDIVTANSGDDSLSVLLGNGDGTFQPALPIPLSFAPSFVAVGDFANHGRLDLVVTDSKDNAVAVILGNGDGTFQTPITSQAGETPTFVAVGHFGNDSNLGLVVVDSGSTTANNKSNTISVLLGNGDGTFYSAVRYTVGLSPSSVAVADVNDDDYPDLVVANTSDNNVSVLLGHSDGTFTLQATYNVGFDPASVAVRDVDHNGRLDVVTANSGDGTVSVLLGNGDGTFQPATSYRAGINPSTVLVGDLNSDGRLDLLTADTFTSTVSVLPGRGDGTFQTADTFNVGIAPNSVATGDLNRDGNLDLVTVSSGDTSANGNSNTITVLLGRGDGTFQPPVFYNVGSQPFSVALGDVNGDGSLDIITANSDNDTVSVLLGRGDGTFLPDPFMSQNLPDSPAGTFSVLPPGSLSASANPTFVAVGDFNNDGHLDLVTADSGDNAVSVLLGKGDGDFASVASYSVAPNTPESVQIGDVNHDGDLDLVSVNGENNTLSVLLGKGDGTFYPSPFSSSKMSAGTFSIGTTPYFVALGDVNNDGRLDLITANYLAGTVSVLLGDGDGNFRLPVSHPVGDEPFFVSVGDFNHDGNLDIATANNQDNTVSVLLGQGDGTFSSATYSVGIGPVSLAVGDLNNDGNPDLISANAGDNTVSVLLGQGNGHFQTFTPENGIASPHLPLLKYLNGDSIPDELILNSAGALLYRQGLPGVPDQFAPPKVLNPDNPARDVTIFQTLNGWAVAAVDDRGNTVSIYRWNAQTGTFQRTLGFTTGSLPVRIAAADLTGDDRDDLVVANAFDNSVTIALQQADGTFSTITRTVGVDPSAIAFAKLGGTNGLAIVVSDQVSGDFSVLYNDANHSFAQQSRYRAGNGLFDIDTSTGQQTVLSQLQTVGVVAGDFTGSASDDIIVLNRGAKSFTLFPNLGLFGDPQPDNTYFPTSAQATQMAALTLPGDSRASVAILMADLDQIWIYRNNGDGTFATPTKINVGPDASGFSVATVHGKFALLVGNTFGDILPLLYDGHGSFVPDRTNLQKVPLAVTDANGDVVLADQQTDQALLLHRIPGTKQYDNTNPVQIDNATHLLAPGAVQLFNVQVGATTTTYLVVANSLSNNILVYQELGNGQFSAPTFYGVGDDPVSLKVADVNGDGIPDLLVANEGSNDVSVLIGSVDAQGKWTATPYQRLNSGGIGPIAVAVQNSNSANGPSLLVTNSDGTVVLLPGIGSAGKGSGFFQDTNPQAFELGTGIVQALSTSNGQFFVVGSNGNVSELTGSGFQVLFGPDVTALAELGQDLLAGLDNGGVGLFTGEGSLLPFSPTGFTDEVSALEALQSGNSLEVVASQRGSDVPIIVSFPFISSASDNPGAGVQLNPPSHEALASNLPGSFLLLVATLLPGSLKENVVDSTSEPAPGEAPFGLFLTVERAVGSAAGDSTAWEDLAAAAVEGRGSEAGRPVPTGWEGFLLGAPEALEQEFQPQRRNDILESLPQWQSLFSFPTEPSQGTPAEPEETFLLDVAPGENYTEQAVWSFLLEPTYPISPLEQADEVESVLVSEWTTLPKGQELDSEGHPEVGVTMFLLGVVVGSPLLAPTERSTRALCEKV